MKDNSIKRTNLYKNVKAELSKSIKVTGTLGLLTLSCFGGLGVFEYTMFSQALYNPQIIPMTFFLGLGGLVVCGVTSKEALRQTLQTLKYTLELASIKNDMENPELNNDYNNLVLKYNKIEKPTVYNTNKEDF